MTFKYPLTKHAFEDCYVEMAQKSPDVFIIFGLNLKGDSAKWDIVSNIDGKENIRIVLKDICEQNLEG